MPDSFIYRRFSFLVVIALILGVLIAQSQQATSSAGYHVDRSEEKTFEIPCQELQLCHQDRQMFLSIRA